MGVSTTGKSGETFPTRILTLESYWGISPVKSQFRTDIDPLKLDVNFLMLKMWPLSKNGGSKPQTVLVGGTLDPNSQGSSGSAWFPQ